MFGGFTDRFGVVVLPKPILIPVAIIILVIVAGPA